MDNFVRYCVNEVFDAIAHSPKEHVATEVIKKMVIDELNNQRRPNGKSNKQCVTAVLEQLRSDYVFCEDGKLFYLDILGIRDDFVSDLFEKVSDLLTNNPNGHVSIEDLRGMVTKTLEREGLPAHKYGQQFFSALLQVLRRNFCGDEVGFYRASEEEAFSPNWICMHKNCRQEFEHTNDFQRHLNESNHFNGRITKEVSKLCKVKLSKTGVANIAVPACRPNYRLQTVGPSCLPNPGIPISASVCPPNHGLQDSSTSKLTMIELNDLQSVEGMISSGVQYVIEGGYDNLSVPSIDLVRGNDNANEDEDGDYTNPIDSVCRERIIRYFCNTPSIEVSRRGNVLADRPNAQNFVECSLVGQLIGMSKLDNENQVLEQHQEVYLNTNEPFCLVTVGVQGSGKSHTLATVLEGCLIRFPVKSVCRLKKPMTTLVLHYDESESSRCEVRYCMMIIILFFSSYF